MLNKQPEQPVGDTFKNRFSEAKITSKKIKNMMGSGLFKKKAKV